jgi:hypothetical protein
VLPGYFTGACARVCKPGKREEKIRQPIQIDDYDLRDLDLSLKVNHSSLSTPANRSCDVKRRGFRSSTWKNERLQRFELTVAGVNGELELGNAIIADARFGEMLLHLFRVRCSEQRSDAEEIPLDWNEDFVHCRHVLGRASDAKEGVQFVDVTVGFDACVILGNTPATEQAGKPLVAGLRVNLHRS